MRDAPSRRRRGPDPRVGAQAYLAALKGGDYQTCYRMLAEGDLVHGSLDGFLGEIPMAPNVERRWFAQIEGATEYRLGEASQRGGEAIVPVNVTTPNLVLWERMLGARSQTREAVQSNAEKQLAAGDYPRLNYSDQLVMVREGDEWRLLAGFAQRARIARMHEQALRAYHQLEFDEALSRYHQMLERIAKAPFSGSGELAFRLRREMKRIEAARASAAAARSYVPKVVLANIETKLTASGNQGMFGRAVNSGGLALDEVELTVSYYSEAGKVVYAEKHTPVALPLEFTDFDLPIAPFKPGETRAIGVALKAPAEIQQRTKPQMAVSGVIFSEPVSTPPKLSGAGAQPPRLTTTEIEARPAAAATPTAAPSATPMAKPENSSASQAGDNSAPDADSASHKHQKKHRRHRHESSTAP